MATGQDSAAFGFNAVASGSRATALGTGAQAAGVNGVAVGAGASVAAGFSNSVAIGAGATATAANQIMLGVGSPGSSSVYTLPGLAPAGSFVGSANQNGGELRLATVDNAGNLGTSDFSVNSLTNNLSTLNGSINTINNQIARISNALETVNRQIMNVGALASALSSIPNLTTGDQRYGCGIGTGVYGSGLAGSAGCVARVSERVWVNAAIAATRSNDSGFGSTPSIAGRFGVFFQWGGLQAGSRTTTSGVR